MPKPAYAIINLPDAFPAAHQVFPTERAAKAWAKSELERHGKPGERLSRWERDPVTSGGYTLTLHLLGARGELLDTFAVVGVP